MKRDPIIDALNREETRVLKRIRAAQVLLCLVSLVAGWLIGVLTR